MDNIWLRLQKFSSRHRSNSINIMVIIIIAWSGLIVYKALYKHSSHQEWLQNLSNVGCFLSGIGLLLLALQFYEQQKTSKQQAQGNIYSMSHTVNRLFYDQPELRSYFYEDSESPDEEPTRSKFNATAEILADHFEFIVEISDTLSTDTRKRWFNYMKRMYSNNKAFKDFMDTSDEFYSKNLLYVLHTDKFL